MILSLASGIGMIKKLQTLSYQPFDESILLITELIWEALCLVALLPNSFASGDPERLDYTRRSSPPNTGSMICLCR